MTEDPIYGPYVRGRLELAGVDLSTPVRPWLDAVYAVWAQAPGDVLERLAKQIAIKVAQMDPRAARETWGRLPEHRAMAGGLGRGPGVESGGGRPPVTQPRLDAARERMRAGRGR